MRRLGEEVAARACGDGGVGVGSGVVSQHLILRSRRPRRLSGRWAARFRGSGFLSEISAASFSQALVSISSYSALHCLGDYFRHGVAIVTEVAF
jgi:hypothetical protein